MAVHGSSLTVEAMLFVLLPSEMRSPFSGAVSVKNTAYSNLVKSLEVRR